MSDFIQAEIFFFITSAAVIVVTMGLVMIIVYAIRILRNIQEILTRVKTESELVSQDVAGLRTAIKQGAVLKILFDFVHRILKNNKKGRKRHM